MSGFTVAGTASELFKYYKITEFPFKPIFEEYKHQNLRNIRECYFHKKLNDYNCR